MSSKITGLVPIANTSVDPTNDLAVIVDVSDATMAGTGSDKRIPVGQLTIPFQQTDTTPDEFSSPGFMANSSTNVEDGAWVAVQMNATSNRWLWSQHYDSTNSGVPPTGQYVETFRQGDGSSQTCTFQSFARDDSINWGASVTYRASFVQGSNSYAARINLASDGNAYAGNTGRGITFLVDTDDSQTGDSTITVEMMGGQTDPPLSVNDENDVTIFAVDADGSLDLSTTQGALIVPRLTTVQRNALSAQNGMIVYDTSLNQFYKRQAGSWTAF